MTDALRTRIAQLDPLTISGTEIESTTTPSSRHRLERVMSTPTTTRRDEKEVVPGTPKAPPRTERRWVLATALAAFVAVVAVVGGVALRGGPAEQPLALVASGGDSFASCIAFDTAILAEMPVAFEGTVTEVAGETATLTVDRWYTATGPDQVTVTGNDASVLLHGGFVFEAGSPYLITATDGMVNFCGFSGPATPELRAAFESAFGA